MLVRRILTPLSLAAALLAGCGQSGGKRGIGDPGRTGGTGGSGGIGGIAGPGGGDGGLVDTWDDWRARIEELLNGGGTKPGTSPGTQPPVEGPGPQKPALVRYVAVDGSDAFPGTKEQPWRTPAYAVTQAEPGMRILVRGGTYPAFVIDGVDGTARAPIVIAAAPGSRPVIEGGTVLVRRAYWELEGLEIRPGSKPAVRFTGASSRYNVLRNSIVRDGTAAYGVSVDLGATYATIEGNEITNIWRGADVDAHGIVIQPDSVGVRILGNEIHGNSGDSIQCIGPGQDAPEGAPARDLLVEGNLLYGDRENAVDVKMCEDVVIRGNVIHGYRKSATSNGEGIVIHKGARNVVVEYNDISNVSRGVVTGVGARDVLVRRNVIHTPADERTGILFGEGSNFAARHNTIIGADRCLRVLVEAKAASVENNIFSGCTQSATGTATVENNLFFNSPLAGAHGITADPQLDAEFRPAAGSPAIDRATVGDVDYCGKAPDIGAVERC